MLPITTEIARAESLHGPLPLHVPPSDTLLNAAVYMESIARTEDPMSPLAILCEEVCEAARAETEITRGCDGERGHRGLLSRPHSAPRSTR